MFTVLYRWKIKAGMEQQFIRAWSEVTAYYRENFNSRGSRLHRGSDGLFYAYAQWESAEAREKAFENIPELEVRGLMKEAVEETFPDVRLEIVSDFLIMSER